MVETSVIVKTKSNTDTTINDKKENTNDSSIIKQLCIYGSTILVGIIILIKLLSKKNKHGGKRR